MNLEVSAKFSRNELFSKARLKELIKFESQHYDTPIRDMPLERFLNPQKLLAGISPDLIEEKVFDTVIRGAEFVRGLVEKSARIETMTSPKQEFSLINYTNFKVKKGTMGASKRVSGGYFDSIELDCSKQNGLYTVEVALDKTWIRDNNFNALERSLEAAGQTMYDEVLSTIVDEYEDDVHTDMTDTVANWGNDHYKALIKGLSLIAAERMYPTIALIHPDEVYDLMILDYFVHSNYSNLAGKQAVNPQTGLAGYLFPNQVPIYFHPEVTAASMTIAAAQKAVIVGVRQDLTIEDFNAVREGKEGGVVTMQWDQKNGSNAGKTKPTEKAWAVATSA